MSVKWFEIHVAKMVAGSVVEREALYVTADNVVDAATMAVVNMIGPAHVPPGTEYKVLHMRGIAAPPTQKESETCRESDVQPPSPHPPKRVH